MYVHHKKINVGQGLKTLLRSVTIISKATTQRYGW